MILSHAQVALLAQAGVLIGYYASECSAFELETLAEVATRVGRFHWEASATELEWAVVEDAIAAMRKAAAGDGWSHAHFLCWERAA